MKFTTIYLEENKIELFNSIIGKEIVKVNGEIVSSKFSLTGTEHQFKLNEQGKESKCKLVTGFGFNGIVIDLYKDNKPIIESPKSGCLGTFLIIVIIAVLIDLIGRLL